MNIHHLKTWDIYKNKSKFKIFVLITALLIGIASIYYTERLVNRLANRERKLIDLYAKGLKNAVEAPNNGTLTFLFQEIIEANNSIPVILTDENFTPLSERNITIPKHFNKNQRENFLRTEVQKMREEHPPITVLLAPGMKNYIFYRNSFLLTQLLYYPYIQLTVIGIFAIIAYMAFSYSRTAEQNRVWVGLAKETAHQLGTPISSMMAWLELLKSNPQYQNEPILPELEKDIERLNMITSRFSNIGSTPSFKPENLMEMTEESISYLRARLSRKVNIQVKGNTELYAKINRPLFEWVIENLSKNAVDAMNGAGNIIMEIHSTSKGIAIDIHDTGKGIPKSRFKEVFKPGYTTKKRGWGLGLTLVKRIVENYHQGKIFVLSSEVGKGATFRILLKNDVNK